MAMMRASTLLISLVYRGISGTAITPVGAATSPAQVTV